MSYYVTDFNKSGERAVALEDCIMVEGSVAAAGSKALEGFTAPFSATVVDRLPAAGYSVAGKTQMSEFGLPSMEKEDAPSGAVRAVLSGDVRLCLCNDLFGVYRRQSAENGLFYIHPSYGTVSRYGLIQAAQSMDQIGVLCASLHDGFSLLAAIAGNDTKDGAMHAETGYDYNYRGNGIRLCLPRNVADMLEPKARAGIEEISAKHRCVSDNLEYFELCSQVMYILSSAEVSCNLSRYDGIKFGYRSANAESLESLYFNTRSEAFGPRAKLAAIMGTMVLSAGNYERYYEKAMKIRRLIRQSLRFDRYDVIILPASLGRTPYDDLALSAVAQLAGLPSISFSLGGCGVQLVANTKNECALLAAWEALQS